MQDNRHITDGVLDALDQVFGFEGAHRAGHVLQAQGVKAHLDQVLAHFNVLFDGVHGALGVADAAGGYGPGRGVLLHGVQGGAQVAEVVQGVEDTDHVDTVLDAQFNELFHHVVMVVLVAQQVLAAQQHLQAGVGHVLADVPQPLKGIFIQIPQAAVERGAAPALNRVVSGLVHGGQDLFKVGIGQPGSHQGLICVTQDGFGELYFLHEPYAPIRLRF